MGGVRGIADEDDRNAPAIQVVPMHPFPADDARKPDPDRRTAQVGGVAHQRVAAQVLRKEALAERDAFLLRHGFEAGGAPGLLRRLDDERRGFAVVLVGVRLEPAVRRVREGERERGKALLRAQPDEAAAAHVDVGRERFGIARADAAVESVPGDHDVGTERARRSDVVGNVLLEGQFDAQRLAPRLQDVQQALAADAAEPVAAAGDRASLEMDVDVVPVVEGVGDVARRLADRRRPGCPASGRRTRRPTRTCRRAGCARPRGRRCAASAFLSSRAR